MCGLLGPRFSDTLRTRKPRLLVSGRRDWFIGASNFNALADSLTGDVTAVLLDDDHS